MLEAAEALYSRMGASSEPEGARTARGLIVWTGAPPAEASACSPETETAYSPRRGHGRASPACAAGPSQVATWGLATACAQGQTRSRARVRSSSSRDWGAQEASARVWARTHYIAGTMARVPLAWA